jgi:hypothetical protein
MCQDGRGLIIKKCSTRRSYEHAREFFGKQRNQDSLLGTIRKFFNTMDGIIFHRKFWFQHHEGIACPPIDMPFLTKAFYPLVQ